MELHWLWRPRIMNHILADHAHVALNMSDGSTAVMGFLKRGTSPTLPFGAQWESSGVWTREASDANIFAEVERMFKDLPIKPTKYTIVPSDTVPRDRTFREALTFETAFSFDLPKAKQVHLDRIRVIRNQELDKLDKDWMKATGRGDQQAAADVEAKRQVLRDLPATLGIAEARTVDELKGCWPAELPPR